MSVKRGMEWSEVLKVRDDFVLESVDEEYGIEYWEGQSYDGGLLSVEVKDGIVDDVQCGEWG